MGGDRIRNEVVREQKVQRKLKDAGLLREKAVETVPTAGYRVKPCNLKHNKLDARNNDQARIGLTW